MPGLPAETRPGPVTLRVRDLDLVVDFYAGLLGMKTLARDAQSASLGVDEELLHLIGDPDAPERPEGTTGLYHVAYLLPSRADLGRFLEHCAAFRIPIAGAGDHLVSESVYMTDPEGNGIEIYADRPRDMWDHKDGRVVMGTVVVDIDGLLALAGDEPWNGMPPGTRVGHVHLQTGDVLRTEVFYRDVIGFDVTARFGMQATFLAAGGYHHHVGANSWAGIGAPPPPQGSAGLVEYTLLVPTMADVEAIAARAGEHAELRDGVARIKDPASNVIAIRAA